MQNVKYGDPRDPQNIMGPLNSAIQRERVEGHVGKAISDGARPRLKAMPARAPVTTRL